MTQRVEKSAVIVTIKDAPSMTSGMISRRDFLKTCAWGVAALVCFPQRVWASKETVPEAIGKQLSESELFRTSDTLSVEDLQRAVAWSKDENVFQITSRASITPAPPLKLTHHPGEIYFFGKDKIFFVSDGQHWHEVGRA